MKSGTSVSQAQRLLHTCLCVWVFTDTAVSVVATLRDCSAGDCTLEKVGLGPPICITSLPSPVCQVPKPFVHVSSWWKPKENLDGLDSKSVPQVLEDANS